MTQARRQLGQQGESAVAEWYERAGFDVVDRNWRCREGEIDLVAQRGATLVFCEVKTRSSVAFGLPQEAVTRKKQLRLRALAAQWLRAREGPDGGQGEGVERGTGRGVAEIRFDVASVLEDEIEVIEAAF